MARPACATYPRDDPLRFGDAVPFPDPSLLESSDVMRFRWCVSDLPALPGLLPRYGLRSFAFVSFFLVALKLLRRGLVDLLRQRSER